MSIRSLLLFLLCCATLQPVLAQSIRGEVQDLDSHEPLDNVNILNIYTNFGMISDDKGQFFIAADKGQLIEFHKMGYKTAHLRIPEGTVPPYFKILMQKGIDIPEYVAGGGGYKTDSINMHNLYAPELTTPKLSTLDKIEHPFTATSRHYQEIWAFQKDYKATQQRKFVDYKFNKDLVTKLTGLTGDSLNAYMVRYRPSYQQVRAWDDYTFYDFIKKSVARYRYGYHPRLSN